ncbi:heavy metal-binding domain-containing protein [Ectobacillus panaciterrae]|nr:heavy metal-binding domain-containing protein [Ectobacillus panaciterrae]
MGVQAVVGVSFDYESVGTKGMLMCVVTGTAVRLEE